MSYKLGITLEFHTRCILTLPPVVFSKCEKIYISGCGWGFFWIFCRSDEKQSENSVFSNLCLEGFSDILKPTSVLSWNEKNMLEELPSKGKRTCAY